MDIYLRFRDLRWPWILGGLLICAWVTSDSIQGQVYIQDSPAAEELLAQAADRFQRNEPEEAARLAQKVIEEYGSKLMELETGVYVEARQVVTRRLLEHEAWLGAYERLYESLAARALAEAGHNRDALTAIAGRYGLTEPGLQAGLRLAGLGLLEGQGEMATEILARLERHPRLSDHRPLWHELSAAAALLEGRQELFHTHRTALEQAKQTQTVQRLDRWSNGLRAGNGVPVLSPMTQQPEAEPPQPWPAAIWNVPLEGAEQFLLKTSSLEPGQWNDQFLRGRYMNVMPVLRGERLYINDGQNILSVEPGSGQVLWRQAVGQENILWLQSNRLYNHPPPTEMDLSGIAAEGGYVTAVCGYAAMSTPYAMFQNPSLSLLVGLGAGDGKLLWSVRPEQVDADLGDAFWYGQPILSGGRVYATLRRRQRTQFYDAYAVALEVGTGQVLWRRHLVSLAVAQRQSTVPLTHMALDQGRLYVDTRLGAVACLSAVDGSVDWIATHAEPPKLRAEKFVRPWEASAPVVCGAGLLVLDDQGEVVRVYEPQSGQLKDSIPMQRWGWPVYLMRLGADVVSVGQQVIRLDGTTLEPRWTYEAGGQELRGRVTAAGRLLYVPVAGAVKVVDAERGHELRGWNMDTPVHLMARPGQFIAVQRDAVRSFSTWDVAQRQLRDQVARQPGSPVPPVCLAWLSLRTQHHDQLFEAVRQAAQGVEKLPAVHADRRWVFEQLMQMIDSEPSLPTDSRQRLFDQVLLVASTPAQEVAYRLRYAQFLQDQGQVEPAVREYQALLADPLYRQQVYHRGGQWRMVRLEAAEQLRQLIKSHGAQIYAPFDQAAAQQLESLIPQSDPQAMIELAESYPLSAVATQATMQAARWLAEQGKTHQAIGLLRRLELHPLTPDQASEVLAHEVALLESAGDLPGAMRVYRFFSALYPAVRPKGSQTQDPLARLAALREKITRGSADRSVALTAEHFKHSLPGPREFPADEGLVILHRDDEILLYRPKDPQPLWKLSIAAEPLEWVGMDRERAWLWSSSSGRLWAVDRKTGRLLWQDQTLADRLEPMQVPLPRRTHPQMHPNRRPMFRGGIMVIPPGGLPGMGGPEATEQEKPPLPWVRWTDVAMSVTDPQGRVVVYSSEDGQVLWQAVTPVRRVSCVESDGRWLVIAGMDEEDEPLTCVYELLSGQLRHRLVKSGQAQRALWIGLTPDGKLLQVTHRQVESFDLIRASLDWTGRPGFQLSSEGGVWLFDDQLLIQVRDNEANTAGDLIWMSTADGQVRQRLAIRDILKFPLWIEKTPDGWAIGGSDHVLAVDPQGQTRWRDAMVTPGRVLDHTVLGSSLILLTGGASEPQAEPAEPRLFLLNLRTGKIENEIPLTGDPTLDRLLPLGGHLLVGGKDQAAVFEIPADKP